MGKRGRRKYVSADMYRQTEGLSLLSGGAKQKIISSGNEEVGTASAPVGRENPQEKEQYASN
jgi:hypothetical protein